MTNQNTQERQIWESGKVRPMEPGELTPAEKAASKQTAPRDIEIEPEQIGKLGIVTDAEEAKELWEAFRRANGFAED